MSDYGNKKIFVLVGFIASIIAIFVFVTGKESIPQFFEEDKAEINQNDPSKNKEPDVKNKKRRVDGRLDLPKYYPVYFYGYRMYDHFREMPLLKYCVTDLGHRKDYVYLNACGGSINYAPSQVEYTRKYYVEYDYPYNEEIAMDFIEEMSAYLTEIFRDPEMPFRYDFEFVPRPSKTGGDAPSNNLRIFLDEDINPDSEDCTDVADTTLMKFVRVFEMAADKMKKEVESK